MENRQHIKILLLQDGPYCNIEIRAFIETYITHNKFEKKSFEFAWFTNVLDTIIHFEKDTFLVIFDYFIVNEVGRSNLTGEHLWAKIKNIQPRCNLIIVTKEKADAEITMLQKTGIKAQFVEKNSRYRSQLSRALNHFLKPNISKTEIV